MKITLDQCAQRPVSHRILELAKLTIEITPPIRPKNHDNVALLAPHYKVPNRLRQGLFCISK